MSKSNNRYFKLGKTAASFYDPVTKLKIVTGGIGKLAGGLRLTRKIETAIRHNHIVEVKEEDYKKWLDSETNSSKVEESQKTLDLNKLTNAQLVKYYKENFEVSEDDLKAFAKLSKDEKIAFLTDDEEEGDEE